MNLLIFSDKNPIGFLSKRQLLWLLEFIQNNYKEINIRMLETFDDSELNYDVEDV